MSTPLVSPPAPPSELPVADLQRCCADEQARYRRNPTPQESVCCLEIVRCAAAHDDETFAALLDLSRPLILRRCRGPLRAIQDEVAQEVATRLFQKFYCAEQPFRVTTFAAYLVYLQLTCASAAHETRARQPAGVSLDALREAGGFEPAAPPPADEVERRMLLDRWLELLPEPPQREAFRRRFALGETPAEIAQAMGITKHDAYRLVEKAVRLLKAIPEVREMLEP